MSDFCIFFFKQKTAYEMRISDWSSDVCSSDLRPFINPSLCLYWGCRFAGYGATRACGISVPDPGAVPGASTISLLRGRSRWRSSGGEIGSTCGVTMGSVPGMVTPLSGRNYIFEPQLQ